MKNLSPQKIILLTVIPAVVVTIVLVGGLYFWVDYRDDQEEVELVKSSATNVSTDAGADIDQWRVVPFFSENLNFYFYYPADWNISNPYSDGLAQEEGHIMWLSSSYEYASDTSGYDYSIGTFFDTGDDLETWVGKKKEEIKKARGTAVEIVEREVNGSTALELCSNGYVAEYPEPACFVYFHSAPYILELRIERYNSSDYEGIVTMTSTLLEKFHLLESEINMQELYKSYNMGYSINYNSEEMPIDEYGAQRIRTFGSADTNAVQIEVSTGATHDLEKYWYDYQITSSDDTSLIKPYELYVDGVRCIYSMNIHKDDYSDVEDGEIVCLINDKLYRITLYRDEGDDASYKKLFSMLSTIQFTVENVADSSHYMFADDVGQYSLIYPSQYELWDEGGNEQAYFSFAEKATRCQRDV